MAAKRSKQVPLLAAFISHAKADAKKASAIAEALESRGFKCWIAPRDVKAGRSYGDEIIRGIESARAFVLVLSKASNGSAFVAREVERAVSKKKPIFAVRIANVEPAPSLELFVSSTQWIDAFKGGLGPHINRLADLLAEEEGVEPVKPAHGGGEVKPRPAPRWIWPMGAAALIVIAAGFVFWPERSQVSNSDPFVESNPDSRAANADQQQALGRAIGLQNVADVDFQACEKASGDAGIAACDRAIASGKFTGRDLSYLYNDRGFMRMQKGDLDKALADLDESIRIDASNFFAFWNRGAVYGAKAEFERAQEDFTRALSLNPDNATKGKIEEALNAVMAGAKAAQSQASDKSVITDPSVFGSAEEGTSADAASSHPADVTPGAPLGGGGGRVLAIPPPPVTPALPAAPQPMPVR